MSAQQQASAKPKRVRTGCLTCRERHLKCDEGLPECHNCKKSQRTCKRGLRLNFLDITVQKPPVVFKTDDYRIDFADESREIASEYRGGLAKYGSRDDSDLLNGLAQYNAQHQHHEQRNSIPQPQQMDHQHHMHIDPTLGYEQSNQPHAPTLPYQELPNMHDSAHSHDPNAMSNQVKFDQPRYDNYADPQFNRHNSTTQSPFTNNNHTQQHHHQQAQTHDQQQQQQSDGLSHEKRDYLDSQEETLFMQVFVEEVGLWMDSMDPMKHFSRLLPFHSLQEPMLLNAFLACGARHLTLINPIYSEEKAVFYYDAATRHLLKALQNPNRDTVICATTAVILNVYEIMCERALQRMNHIAGARALIKECGWNARATGIGAACFWLNVGLEVLSCLHFNWQVAWDPDDWQVDMDFAREVHNGREEIWTHRVLYIVAKVCNFRATIPRFQEADPRDEDARRGNRYNEWQRLKGWADAWNENIPRTMHPMAYVYPEQTTSKSAFPEVWLIKRSTIVARLFYHTAMLLLAQTNPYMSIESSEMWEMQKTHALMICGISAHVKDRGVASVALRSLAHAAECLTAKREQEEVLQIFTKINKETGWRIAFIFKELKEKWNWKDDPNVQQVHITSNTDPKVRSVGMNPVQQQPSSASSSPNTFVHPNIPSNNAGQSAYPGAQQQPRTASQSQQPRFQSSTSSASSGVSNPAAPSPGGPLPPAAAGGAPNRRPPAGIVNPMFATADFSMPQHPYQQDYVPPNQPPQAAAAAYHWGVQHGGQAAAATAAVAAMAGLGQGGYYPQ